jgi:DNA-binding MarR family transcriptional regulator
MTGVYRRYIITKERIVKMNQQQAMEIWRRALSDTAPDLTARQMALLLTVYTASPAHTVRGLSGNLKMLKPAVTRALDTLRRMDLLRRKRDQEDKRSVLIQRTVKGSVYLSEFADSIVNAVNDVKRLAASK